jgi:hypothetical protein
MGRKSSGGKRGLNMRGNARAAGVIRWALEFAEGEINEEKETIAIRALLFLSST